MNAAARTLTLVPPVIPEGWYVWRGLHGLFYARRPRSSPPLVARAATEEELPAAISKVLADREALHKRLRAQMGEQRCGYLIP